MNLILLLITDRAIVKELDKKQEDNRDGFTRAEKAF